MSATPPPKDYPVALVLEPHELDAITTAVTVYDLLVEGCISEAVDMTSTENDGGLTRQTLAALTAVDRKVVRAQEPMLRAVRAWMAERGMGRGERG